MAPDGHIQDSGIQSEREIRRATHLLVLGRSCKLNDIVLDTSKTERITKGVYLIATEEQTKNIETCNSSFYRFKRIREIPSRKESTTNQYHYTFTIVTYEFINPTQSQKKSSQDLIRKAMCVRIRPGVVLFPYFRKRDKKHIQRFEEKLLDSKIFTGKMHALGAIVQRWTRVTVTNTSSKDLVQSLVDSMTMKNTEALEQAVKGIITEVKEGSANKSQMKSRLGHLRSRYLYLKNKNDAFETIWNTSHRRAVKRIYNLLLKARNLVDSL